jgi:hypothetical protein
VKDITTIINSLECKKKWRRWIMKGHHYYYQQPCEVV